VQRPRRQLSCLQRHERENVKPQLLQDQLYFCDSGSELWDNRSIWDLGRSDYTSKAEIQYSPLHCEVRNTRGRREAAGHCNTCEARPAQSFTSHEPHDTVNLTTTSTTPWVPHHNLDHLSHLNYPYRVSRYYLPSCFHLKHTMFRRLDSVSVFRWNVLSFVKSIEPVLISGSTHLRRFNKVKLKFNHSLQYSVWRCTYLENCITAT
jgi:hypothetical protein